MSNTSFPFGPGNTQYVTGPDPALVLADTSISPAAWNDIQNIAGVLWLAINAFYNGTTWLQINQLLPSYAMTLNNTGVGSLSFYSAAAVGGTASSVPITFIASGGLPNFGYPFAMRNKTINGNMEVDQRNGGAVITPTNNQYGVDRWKFFLTQAGKVTSQQIAIGAQLGVPAGFATRIASTSSYSVSTSDQFLFAQPYEAINIQELAWGTAGAVPVAVSFWARVSTPGTFSVALQNFNGSRSFVSTFTVTDGLFHLYSMTVPGDTTGSWNLTGNTIGVFLSFDLGSGSTLSTATLNAWQAGNFAAASGATKLVSVNTAFMDITAIQLETGSTVTPFEQRTIGLELELCQRYCYLADCRLGGAQAITSAYGVSATSFGAPLVLPVTMRSAPSLTLGAAASNFFFNQGGSSISATGITLGAANPQTVLFNGTLAASGVLGDAGYFGGNASAFLLLSAEL